MYLAVSNILYLDCKQPLTAGHEVCGHLQVENQVFHVMRRLGEENRRKRFQVIVVLWSNNTAASKLTKKK